MARKGLKGPGGLQYVGSPGLANGGDGDGTINLSAIAREEVYRKPAPVRTLRDMSEDEIQELERRYQCQVKRPDRAE